MFFDRPSFYTFLTLIRLQLSCYRKTAKDKLLRPDDVPVVEILSYNFISDFKNTNTVDSLQKW